MGEYAKNKVWLNVTRKEYFATFAQGQLVRDVESVIHIYAVCEIIRLISHLLV
jgi:hypothetical protein